MTDTTERVAPAGRTGLAAMNVADLKRLASGLGVTGTTKMRKDDLVAAIYALIAVQLFTRLTGW